jgi:hypothetical protein
VEESNKGIAPFLVAILLCDDVIQDANTKKNSLIGIFDRIFSEKFPATHPKFKIYMKMANAEKEYDFIVEYVQVKTDKVLAKGYLTIKVPSGFAYADIVLDPPPITIPEPGDYEFRLYANLHYIGRIKFTAEKVIKKGEINVIPHNKFSA